MKTLVVISLNALFFTSFGCMSQITAFSEYANSAIGSPIDTLIEAKQRPGSFASRAGWKDKRYKLENGNWVYVSPEREGCIVHWEINSQGIIVGYSVEGSRCNWK